MLRNFFYSFIALSAVLNQIVMIGASSPEIIDERFIQVPGAELFCRVMGSGNPLIILHGGAGFATHDYLLPHMHRLAENNLVVFYDQRGLGRSTGVINFEQINIRTYVEDIEAIRSSLGTKKISLLGHSWGGFLAMHYAFLYPESIDKLILVASMPGSSDDLGLFFQELKQRLTPYRETLEQIESSESYLLGDPQTVENHLKIVYKTYMYCPENVNKLNLWKSQTATLNGFKVWSIFKENIFMKPYDLSDRLRSLRCPTLIIHGDADPIPFLTAEHVSESIPLSKLIKMEECGHFPFVEKPEATFKAIKDFVN